MRNSLSNIDSSDKVIVAYITAGDGGMDKTAEILEAMESSEADVIQLGIPFSDPVAESAVIQDASVRSIESGTTLIKTFELLSNCCTKAVKPLVLRVYINTIFGFGKEKFFSLCKLNGVSGIIIPDIPFEEREEISEEAEKAGTSLIQTVTPFSKERTEKIAAAADGYLNCATMPLDTAKNIDFLKHAKLCSEVPCIMDCDFGKPEDFIPYRDHCDGFVISSMIVRLMSDPGNTAEKIKKLINDIAKAVK